MRPDCLFGGLRLLNKSSQFFAQRAARLLLLAGTSYFLAACGSGHPQDQTVNITQTPVSDGAGETVAANLVGPETSPAVRILSVPGGTSAKVALFPDGLAFYSADGINLGGGGSTIAAYAGTLKIIDIVAVSGGIDALLSDGTVFFSPDGQNLGGGGNTLAAYNGPLKVASLNPVNGGIDAVMADNAGVIFSPDGHDLSGSSSTPAYTGDGTVLQLVAVGPGDAVVTLFSNGTAWYSPNNQNLGGGGSTLSATPGGHETVKQLAKIGGGVLVEFDNESVYLSPDGKNFAGGGTTIPSPRWNTKTPNGPFPARDSAHGAQFLGHLWISGGFADPTNDNSCFVTCSFYDLWSSTDSVGATWNSSASFATSTTPDPRDETSVVNNGVQDAPVPADFYDPYSAVVVWNQQLTAVGHTVWRSADGVTWARQNLSDGSAAPGPLPIIATENTRTVILGSSLFLVQPDSGEVYRSTDPNAAVWTDLGAIPNFTPRCASTVFVVQEKIWIEGGGACDYSSLFSDIWSSADGVSWTKSAKSPEWPARMWPCIAQGEDGVIWLAGGYAPTDWQTNASGSIVPRYAANHADVWYTKDGLSWRQFKADLGSLLPDDGGLEPRHAPTCYRVPGSGATGTLVIMAGTGASSASSRYALVLNSIRTLPLPPAASLP